MKTIVLGALLLMSSCDTTDDSPPVEEPSGGDEAAEPEAEAEVSEEETATAVEVGAATEADTEAFAASTRRFAVDLWGQLRSRDGNLAVSPASISVALAMTWAGARGETAEQMARTLHFGDDPQAIHRAAHAQLARWNDPERDAYTLRVANRLFAQRGMPLEPPFVALTRDAYDAPIESLDFRGDPEAARVHINDWVEEQTNDRIEDLLPSGSIDDTTRLVLTNAVYFHGTWKYRFPEEATEERPFHTAGGASPRVPTMRIGERFGWAREGGVQLLEMPYVGDELSMVIVLPNERDGLGAVEAGLSAEQLDGWLSALSVRQVNVLLPRFRIDPPESVRLKPTLSAMGMPLAFTNDADFTAMSNPTNTDEQLHVDDVYHQAFVEVNEEGTEAAAATAAVMVTRGMGGGPPPPPTFRADHPFLFLLRDTRSGAILFMGRVADPR